MIVAFKNDATQKQGRFKTVVVSEKGDVFMCNPCSRFFGVTIALVLFAFGETVNAQSYGGGWVEWAPNESRDGVVFTHHNFVRHSAWWMADDPFWEGDFEVALADGSSLVDTRLSYNWVWHPPAGLDFQTDRGRYGAVLFDTRYAVGELDYSTDGASDLLFQYDICCRFAEMREGNSFETIVLDGSVPAAMITKSPTVFRPFEPPRPLEDFDSQTYPFPEPTENDGTPGMAFGDIETDLFEPGTLISATPGVYTLPAGQETTVHTGIVLPETDAAGQALEWHFRFADTSCSGLSGLPGEGGSCLTDPIPGSGEDALELNGDGSFTWAPGTDQAGMYATQIIAYEQTHGTKFPFDFMIQVVDGAKLEEFYYTTAVPLDEEISRAVPSAGAWSLMVLGFLSLAFRRWRYRA